MIVKCLRPYRIWDQGQAVELGGGLSKVLIARGLACEVKKKRKSRGKSSANNRSNGQVGKR